MKHTAKIALVSLGCPKNIVDAEVMLHELTSAGFELTGEDIDADVVIVNTCAFIESAKAESIDSILDVAWLKKHRRLKAIIATGCMAQRYAEDIRRELPEVDGIVGTGSMHDIVEAVEAVLEGKQYTSLKPNSEVVLGGDRVITTPEYSVYLKIAEGCDNRCAYCAIPGIRGGFRSRTIEDIVTEARDLESLGAKEIILVAQDTSRYGLDIYGEYRLAALIQAITAATEHVFLRLLYCYPDKITDELVCELRDNPRLLKYIDLPVQHISDRLLASMNRHGDSSVIRDAISRLRSAVPGIVLRSTAIVGFPGETDEEFEELCDFVSETRFERFGAFAYSREEDTPAYDFPDQIDEQIKQDRLDTLMGIQMNIHNSRNETLLGSTVTVLCEGFDPVAEVYFGRSAADAPDIDSKVYFTSTSQVTEGDFVDVLLNEAIDYDLYGTVSNSRVIHD